MAETRVYAVTQTLNKNGVEVERVRLIDAVSQAAARNFVSKETLKVEVASVKQAMVLGADGVTVEKASAE